MAKESHIKAIEEEFKEIEESTAWNQVYQKVRTEGTYDLSCSIAKLPQNKNLNRYRDVLPYDHSRIVLHGSNTDYINASLVEVPSINRSYILCQGPLSITTPHFWLLIWQQNCKGIVMLNKVMEKNQIKCHQYWPLGEKKGAENTTIFNSVNLKVELLKDASHSHYIYRTFRLTNLNTKEHREILHFHYTTWPDFGVPQSPEAFFKFLNVVRSSQCLESQFGPAVIHCSAGIGRSGTFCLVDSILRMLSQGLCTSEPGKVLEVLLEMRRYRMGLIQTPDQLKFSYQAIIYGAHQMDETNGKDPSEESSSEEVSQEEPPPLPPPRTDSLTRSMLDLDDTDDGNSDHENSSDDSTDGDSNHDDSLDEDQKRILSSGNYQRENDTLDLKETLGRPLPQEPSAVSAESTSESTAPPSSEIQSRSSQNEVRRRREERIEAKVRDIKEKSRVAEDWQERKQLLFQPLSLCAALLVVGLGGGLVYYYRMQQS